MRNAFALVVFSASSLVLPVLRVQCAKSTIWYGRTKIPSIHRRDFGPGDQNHCHPGNRIHLGSRLCFCAGRHSTVYPVSGLV